MLGAAFAVSAEVPLDEVEEIKKCINEFSGKELVIDGKVKVNIVKGDVRERKGKAMLIFRYEYMEGF